MGSLISGILGGGQSDAQAGQSAALQAARDSAQAYRPEAMQARLNLLSKASNAYGGMNNAMETMYGGRSPKVGAPSGMAPQSSAPQQPTFAGMPMPQQLQPQGQSSHHGFNPMTVLDPANIFGGW